MKKVSLLLLFCIALLSCKKTVEGETTAWNANKTKLNKLKANYPAFASVLDNEMKEAQAKWDEATKLSNEEEKLKKMSEANYTFNQGFVYDLDNLETKIKNINTKNNDLLDGMTAKDVNLSKSDQKEIIRIRDDARDVLSEVKKSLNKGDKSSSQAYKTIENAKNALVEIERRIDMAQKAINDSKKKNTDSQKDSTTTKKKKRVS
jgi:chromosome segregation ATPase